MSRIPPFPTVPLSDRNEFPKHLRKYLEELPNHFDAFEGVFEEQLLTMFSSLLGLDCLIFTARLNSPTEVKVTCDKPPRKVTACNKKFEVFDQAFMCKDCFPNPDAILCEGCFDKEAHFDHNISFMNRVNLTDLFCHCGDPEVSLGVLGCSQHTEEISKASKDSTVLPSKMCARLTPFIKTMLEFIIDVFRCSLRIQQESYKEVSVSQREEVINSIWGARTRENLDTKTVLRLWADHDTNLGELVNFFKRTFSFREAETFFQVKKLHETGKLDFSANLSMLQNDNIILELNALNVGASYHSKQMSLLEDLASSCLWFLSILSSEELEASYDGKFSPHVRQILGKELLRSSTLFPKSYDIRSFNKSIPVGSLFQVSDVVESPLSKEYFTTTRVLLDQIDVTLMSPDWLKTFEDTPLNIGTFNSSNSQPILQEITSIVTLPRTRLDWLLKLTPNYWWQINIRFQSLLLSLFKTPGFKNPAILRIVINYPSLAQHFSHRIVITKNRRNRFWINVLADKQLCLVIARDLHFLRYLIMSLEKDLLGISTKPDVYASSFSPPEKMYVFKEETLKNSQFIFLMFSLRRLLKCSSLSKHLVYDHVFQAQFLHFLSTFQGMGPITLHKTYPERKEAKFGNVISSLSHQLRKLIDTVVDLLNINPLMMILAARHTLRKIWAVMEWNLKPTPDPNSTQDMSSGVSTASYYNILHYYLSKLLECPQLHNPNYINKLGFDNLLHLLLGHKNFESQDSKKLLAIFVHPIKTLALLSRAQFHANFKKEFPTSQPFFEFELDKQMINYCYLVQIMLSIFQPEQALNAILTTYGLQNWVWPNLNHLVYTNQEHFYMAADFIKLLLHCFSERDMAESDFFTRAIKLSALYLFQPKDQDFLFKVLPEWLTHSPHYTHHLSIIAGYDLSLEQSKSKLPLLKISSEQAHMLNPYHYFIKQSDLFAARSVKKTHESTKYYILHFPSFPLGTFQNIWAIFHSPLLTKFIFYTLLHINQSSENQEILADYVLQLYSIAHAEYSYFPHSREHTPASNLWTNAIYLFFQLSDGTKNNCYGLLLSMENHPSFSQIPEKYKITVHMIMLLGFKLGDSYFR